MFVLPGTLITSDQGYLSGHGTQVVENNETGSFEVRSSCAGEVQRVNKLISVTPLRRRYVGEVGDLIIGRVAIVESKRWKIDLFSSKDGILHLSSVTLPGGVQRMRTYEDQLQMRALYQENDLLSMEIQNVMIDGTISLHTRSLKYGKLENGIYYQVPSVLIKRLAQHYVTLPYGLDIILGKNGCIWITRSVPEEWKESNGSNTNHNDSDDNDSNNYADNDSDDQVTLAETLQRIRKRHASTPLTVDERLRICRVRNVLALLVEFHIEISPDSICKLYDLSERQALVPKDLILLDQQAKSALMQEML